MIICHYLTCRCGTSVNRCLVSLKRHWNIKCYFHCNEYHFSQLQKTLKYIIKVNFQAVVIQLVYFSSSLQNKYIFDSAIHIQAEFFFTFHFKCVWMIDVYGNVRLERHRPPKSIINSMVIPSKWTVGYVQAQPYNYCLLSGHGMFAEWLWYGFFYFMAVWGMTVVCL